MDNVVFQQWKFVYLLQRSLPSNTGGGALSPPPLWFYYPLLKKTFRQPIPYQLFIADTSIKKESKKHFWDTQIKNILIFFLLSSKKSSYNP